MNISDLILGYVIGKNDSGGSSVDIEELTVTENGEYSEDGVAYSPVIVNVAGSASNIKTGTFTTTAGENNYIHDVDTEYTGNGYPIAGLICVDGGLMSNAAWQAMTQKIGFYAFAKSTFSTTPAYNGGANDNATTHTGYKYSGNYSKGGVLENSIYKQSDPQNSISGCLSIKNKNTIRCYVNQANDYGFAPGITYRYWIIYSE